MAAHPGVKRKGSLEPIARRAMPGKISILPSSNEKQKVFRRMP
jgi:hypothetical protein